MSRAEKPDASRMPDRLQAYLEELPQIAGHADRVVPIENYTEGLLLPIERKSVKPMAARLAPGRVRQMLQSLHHIVAEAPWSDESVLRRVREQVLSAMTRREKLAAWIVDDSGFPKKGPHSVGVTHQYCGQLKNRPVQHCSELIYITHYQNLTGAFHSQQIVGTTHNFALF